MSSRRAIFVGGLAVVVVLGTSRKLATERLPVAAPIVVRTAYVERADTLRYNETLTHLFARHGIAGVDLRDALAAAEGLNPRRVRAGQTFTFRHVAGDERASHVSTRISDEQILVLEYGSEGWKGRHIAVGWSVALHRASGRIRTSLYETLEEIIDDDLLPASERGRLAWEIADGVFGWVVDFTRDLYPGDQMHVLFERHTSTLGDVRAGRVLAMHLDTRGVENTAYMLPAEGGRLEYFTSEGQSLRRAFLLRPVAFNRVTSGYSNRRFHPVLKTYRAHRGVDWDANVGTEIFSTAEGTVTRAGSWGSYGIMVEIRHSFGVITRYAHMSRVAKGMVPGRRVKQGEVIGFAGMTGTATGPHVHYEFIRNGTHVNPRTAVNYGSAKPVPAQRRAEFDELRNQYLSLLFPSVVSTVAADID